MVLNRFTIINIYTQLLSEPAYTNYHDTIYAREPVFFGVAEGSMKLDKVLCESQLEFGTCGSAKFETQLFDLSDDVTGYYIEVRSRDTDEQGNVSLTNLFWGRIDSAQYDSSNVYRQIIAYDEMYYIRDKDVSASWNGSGIWRNESELQNGITLKTLRERLVYSVGIQEYYPVPSLTNDNVVFKRFSTFSSIKFGTLLKMICEMQGTFPYIVPATSAGGADLSYISLETAEQYSIPMPSTVYDTNQSKFENFATDPIDSINVYSTSNDLSHTWAPTTSTNPYSIVGNVFLLSMGTSALNQVLSQMLSVYSAIPSIMPCGIKMIQTDMSLKLGDLLSVVIGSSTRFAYIMHESISGALMIDQSIDCYAVGPTRDKSLSAVNNEIINGMRMSKIEQTIDGIELEVQAKNSATQSNTAPTDPVIGDLWYCTLQSDSTHWGRWWQWDGTQWVVANDKYQAVQISNLQIQAGQISAEVSTKADKEGGESSTFGWSLTSNGFYLNSNGQEVFKVEHDGVIHAKGLDVTNSGNINANKVTCNDIDIANAKITGNHTVNTSTVNKLQSAGATAPSSAVQTLTFSTRVITYDGTSAGTAKLTITLTFNSSTDITQLFANSAGYQKSIYIISSRGSAKYREEFLIDVPASRTGWTRSGATLSRTVDNIPYTGYVLSGTSENASATIGSFDFTMTNQTTEYSQQGIVECVYAGTNIVPDSSAVYDLGTAQMYFDTLHAVNFDQISSRSKKKDIEKFSPVHEKLFDALQPKMFKYINGKSDRTHFGFIADEVAKAILDAGLSTKDCAIYVNPDPNDAEDKQGTASLRYTEFISLLVWQMQEMKKRIEDLENKLKEKE